jgi:hypothetical protein
MNKENHDTMLLEKLLDRYRLNRPVPPDAQDSILSSKKRNLVRVLKTTGAFTAAYGAFLSIYFALKKMGIGVTVMKFVISGVSVAAIAYGGYYVMVVRSGADRAASPAVKTLSLDEIRAQYKWVDEITLYSGKVFRGAVMSRGETYRVLTTEGIVMIPRSQIKMVKPLKISDEEQ